MPPFNRNKILQQFFKPVKDFVANLGMPGIGPTQPRSVTKPGLTPPTNLGIRKGTLVTFDYLFHKNDESPLVIVSNEMAGGKLWGVNLHYLTLPYMRKIISLGINNPAFSYLSISNDPYIRKAFRSYKWTGIRNLQISDYRPIINVISAMRSFDPAEVQIIRRQAKEQMQRQINPKASEMTNLEGEGAPGGGE